MLNILSFFHFFVELLPAAGSGILICPFQINPLNRAELTRYLAIAMQAKLPKEVLVNNNVYKWTHYPCLFTLDFAPVLFHIHHCNILLLSAVAFDLALPLGPEDAPA